jgi:SAM-dependent methyltransferase
VTGLDFSTEAVAYANQLAADLDLDADFVAADVYDAVAALDGRRFDIVYTGLGALIWLPDIERWAATVAALLEPGGFLYLSEFHPIIETMADDSLTVLFDYFTRPAGTRYEEAGTYTDGGADTVHNVSYEWTHPISSVVSALLDQGLALELLHEHDFTLWGRFPFLEAHEDGTYRMPTDLPRLPLMYSLRARKPA